MKHFKFSRMRANFQIIGLLGEIFAAGFYFLRGYQVKAWRRRFGRLEADLLVQKGGRTMLIEVKSGISGSGAGFPERKLDQQKVKNLAALARILKRGTGDNFSVELLVVDFSRVWPRFRRYPNVCLW